MAQIGFPMGVATTVSGLSAHQVRHLADRGLVTPTLGAPRGKGTQARYAFFDLLQLRVAQRLRVTDDGNSGALARAMGELEKLRRGGWTSQLLLTSDWESFWLETDEQKLLARLDQDALLIVVSLGRLDAQLRVTLEQFGLGAPADPLAAQAAAA